MRWLAVLSLAGCWTTETDHPPAPIERPTTPPRAARTFAATVLVVAIALATSLVAETAPIGVLAETLTAHAPFLLKHAPTE